MILRAFAADEFKSARSLASSVRLKAQAKLIDDPAGKPAPPAGDGSRDQQEAGRVSHAEKFGARCEVRPSKNAELVPAAVKC